MSTFTLMLGDEQYAPITDYIMKEPDEFDEENWANLLKELVKLYHPQILPLLTFEPESGLLDVECEDRLAFDVFVQLVNFTVSDPERYLRPLVKEGAPYAYNYEEWYEDELEHYQQMNNWKSMPVFKLGSSPKKVVTLAIASFIEITYRGSDGRQIELLMTLMGDQFPAPYDTESGRRPLAWKMIKGIHEWDRQLQELDRAANPTEQDFLDIAQHLSDILYTAIPTLEQN